MHKQGMCFQESGVEYKIVGFTHAFILMVRRKKLPIYRLNM